MEENNYYCFGINGINHDRYRISNKKICERSSHCLTLTKDGEDYDLTDFHDVGLLWKIIGYLFWQLVAMLENTASPSKIGSIEE